LSLSLWQVAPPEDVSARPDTEIIALDGRLADRHSGIQLWFHEAMEAELDRAPQVNVWIPHYRGKSFIGLLAWLVHGQLALPGAVANWWLEKKQGPDSVARIMLDSATDIRIERKNKLVCISTRAAHVGPMPEPASFVGPIGSHSLRFHADYGIFSPRQIDEGTALLAEVALKEQPVEVVADIGTGYGALAIGLIANGIAQSAYATDIDSVALWLAQRNARQHGLDVSVKCTPYPADVAATELTVCNFPTHISAADSNFLMSGLIRRCGRGKRLLIVVHSSLEGRYGRHLVNGGLDVERCVGRHHTVLAASGRRLHRA
jgi:Methyltransferase small domain